MIEERARQNRILKEVITIFVAIRTTHSEWPMDLGSIIMNLIVSSDIPESCFQWLANGAHKPSRCHIHLSDLVGILGDPSPSHVFQRSTMTLSCWSHILVLVRKHWPVCTAFHLCRSNNNFVYLSSAGFHGHWQKQVHVFLRWGPNKDKKLCIECNC